MLTTINISTTALAAFSKALDTVSNNVSNMNTPGYKGTRVEFGAHFSQGLAGQGGGGGQAIGNGVSVTNTVVNFKTGDFAETKDKLNLAIDGGSFFILKDEKGNYTYTKNGGFSLVDGYLVGEGGARVQGRDKNGNLADISVNGDLKTNPAARTTTISNPGIATLAAGSASGTTQPIKLYDAQGSEFTLIVKYTKDTSVPNITNKWKIELFNKADIASATAFASKDVTFDPTGKLPTADQNWTNIAFPTLNGQNMKIKMDLSKLELLSGSTSNVQIAADGRPRGAVTSQEFTETGEFLLTYTNGEKDKSQQIAVAHFQSVQQLSQISGGSFVLANGLEPAVGDPASFRDKLKVGFIEKGNVDLSSEFSELIVIQRCYQAASQMASTANQMWGNLLDMKRG